MRFANRNFETTSCSYFKTLPNRSTQRNVAFSAWSEFNYKVNNYENHGQVS